MSCSICHDEDNHKGCSRITAGVDTTGVTYCDIFGTTEQQIKIIKIQKQVSQNGKKIMNKSPSDGGQAHPQ